MLKGLIEFIAKSLVDYPDEVALNEIEGEKTTILELSVADNDLGKIIGRRGRTAKAMRTVLTAAATKLNKRAVLEIIE
ncbi:MAG: KH domain-containing protein [Candidatus Poribacteria bacterium]